jgi:mRNA-degrading endonuclease toxin of MazEF toxin-antitoxin module
MCEMIKINPTTGRKNSIDKRGISCIEHFEMKGIPVLVGIPKGEGGLKKDSVVDCAQIHTIHKDELFEYCGSLPASRMAHIDRALAISLALR